jgi:hypothetical protein
MKRRWAHNVYITKLVEPKVINRVGRGHKVTFTELPVGLRGGDVELVKNPFFDETLVASGLFVTRRREGQEIYNLVFISRKGETNFRCGFGFECLVKFQHSELGRVEYLVAKLAVTFHT